MSFKVNFWAFSKRPNSTKRPSTTADNSFDCTLKGPCSIMAPVFEVNYGNAGTDPIGYNYCYVPAFDRYYWVSDWVNDGPIWECNAVEDELATWKTAIGNSSQYILRSSHSHDGDIVDNYYPTKAGSTIRQEGANIWPSTPNGGWYVVGIMNKDDSSDPMGAVSYYVFTHDGLVSLCKALFADTSFTQFVAGGTDSISDPLYKSLFDPMQYITSCMWLPVEPHTKPGAVSQLPYGYWTLTLPSPNGFCERLNMAYYHTSLNVNITNIPKHPQAATRGNYLNLGPFSRYNLIFKPWGMIPIDPVYFINATNLYCTCDIDCITGAGVLNLSAVSSGGAPFYTQTAQVGVPIQLAQMSRDYLGAAMSATGGVAGTIMAGLTGNIPGAIANAAGAIGSTAASLLPQLSTTGANGSLVEMAQTTVLTGTFLPLVDEDNADRGRPLCKVGTISSYPGYLVIADPDVSISEANQTEMEAIRRYMSEGFFYE